MSLMGPNQQKLPLVGWFQAKLRKGEKEVVEDVYVVRHLQWPLLGRPAIKALGLAVRVERISKRQTEDVNPKPFQGLGQLRSEYRIQLKEDAKPHALTTPRRIAIPLLPRVKAQLQRMESLGVIVPVEDPTDLCSGMVVVPKADRKVRICVDLTKLNESVRRERHPLQAVDQTLAQLAGAKLFTKLDANSGFWQVTLAPESQLLTPHLSLRSEGTASLAYLLGSRPLRSFSNVR